MPGENVVAGDNATIGDVSKGGPATRSMVGKAKIPVKSPPLTHISQIIVFDVWAKDKYNHENNWRYVDGEGIMRQIAWLTTEHELTPEERTTGLKLSSETLGAKLGDHAFYVFARVEEGQ